MLLELLSGIATKIDCTVFSLLTKICGRVQTRQKTQLIPQISQNSPLNSQIVASPSSPIKENTFVYSPSSPIVNSEIKSKRGKDADGRTCLSVTSSVGPNLGVYQNKAAYAPYDINAETNMVIDMVDRDNPPTNKPSSLQEFFVNTSYKGGEVEVELRFQTPESVVASGPRDSIHVASPHRHSHSDEKVITHSSDTHSSSVKKLMSFRVEDESSDRERSAEVAKHSIVCLGSGMSSALETAVVGDTGATVAVIGSHHIHLADNIRLLPLPIPVSTASGVIELTHVDAVEIASS